MSDQEKIELVAEALELEASEITLDTELANLAEYDSMAKLSIIVLVDEEFDKTLKGEEIAQFKTIGDIVKYMS